MPIELKGCQVPEFTRLKDGAVVCRSPHARQVRLTFLDLMYGSPRRYHGVAFNLAEIVADAAGAPCNQWADTMRWPLMGMADLVRREFTFDEVCSVVAAL